MTKSAFRNYYLVQLHTNRMRVQDRIAQIKRSICVEEDKHGIDLYGSAKGLDELWWRGESDAAEKVAAMNRELVGLKVQHDECCAEINRARLAMK